jgi:hypothetical protein
MQTRTTPPITDPPVDDDGPATDLLPPRRRRGIAPLTAVLGVALVGAAAFFGGIEAQKAQGGSSSAAAAAPGAPAGAGAAGGFAGRRAAGGFGGGFGGGAQGAGAGAQGAGGFGGGASGGVTNGTVKLVKGKDIYVTDASGNTVKVAITGSSAVTKTVSTTIAGIHPGDTVLAVGAPGKNGTVAATQVRVTPATGSGG